MNTDYIAREAARDLMYHNQDALTEYDLNSIPAADVEPVRHAEWEWFDELNGNPLECQDRDWGWRCSGCKMVLPDDYDDPDSKPDFKYCHECGAKMDGGSDNGKMDRI